MIGVLVSGKGTNLQALIDAGLPVAAVGSNRRDAYALVRASASGIPSATFSLDCHPDREERDLVMARWLEEHGVDLVVLAGYMHLLTRPFLDRFPGRIVNVHPSLLPEFPGLHAIEDALAAGVSSTGVTVHLVDGGIDTGPVIRQESVSVEPRETLEERIHAVEHRLLPEVVASMLATMSPAAGGPRSPMRALISVYDKHGIETFAAGLRELGFEIVSSGGTASFLEEHGIEVTSVEEVTSAPEMLGGRVKTLHPNIHAGILARRDLEEDRATLEEHGIEPFDLVCVNLYPFTSLAGRFGVEEADIIEMIDVGGPSLLRAAAKNFAYVAPVCRPEQYDPVVAELRDGAISAETRRALAAEAFAVTAAYDAAIARWFAEDQFFPDQLTLTFRKIADLPYGENPHQTAAYYEEVGSRKHLLSRVNQLGGRGLSYNNLADLEAARRVLRELTEPSAVVVKHANPCGVATAPTIVEAYERAVAADPLSAFGCVLMVNRPVEADLATLIAGRFTEVVQAPEFEDDALELLVQKPALRILRDRERRADTRNERDYKRVVGGLLVQERDAEVDGREGMEAVVGTVDEAVWDDLLFAWTVCKHASSNAIVLAKGLQTIGIGAGQMSRVDAVRIAVQKAQELGHDVSGCVLASDAFFPFADGPQLALDAGVKAIIQPGGSKNDGEVIKAVTDAGVAMVFTGRRHFRH